ncbi:hypothetical protein DSO57_1007420 [Entomophthora muscae]|uniref:Uncharacterized protein n=1 Tax=Entomophthora muscae TaxID=34485 RepID=A0ACC2T755_9FUNG|nr:hypothetical protein DSO57_1007420 [Entomophthora muscae]
MQAFLKSVEENFHWGWDTLSRLGKACKDRSLLNQSRFMLALRYHSDYLEMMKLMLYIPKNPAYSISQVPVPTRLNTFTRKGLLIAIRNVHLVSTINHMFPTKDCIRFLIPSIVFLISHFQPAAKAGQAAPLAKCLILARKCLERALESPLTEASAFSYLKLFDFLVKQNAIKLP